MGLGQYKVSGGFAVSDMESAREFYEGKLGLPVGTDSGDNVSYRCGGDTTIYVYLSPGHAGKSTATLAGWHVDDAERRHASRGCEPRGQAFSPAVHGG